MYTNYYGFGEIRPIDVVKETEKSVVVRGKSGGEFRMMKDTNNAIIRDTWEEVHAYLIMMAKASVVRDEANLGRGVAKLKIIQAMKKPEGVE
jgi:hypothetical protein